eukprot:scaffold11596_cov128-Isochrysis_galbana.AAC.3
MPALPALYIYTWLHPDPPPSETPPPPATRRSRGRHAALSRRCSYACSPPADAQFCAAHLTGGFVSTHVYSLSTCAIHPCGAVLFSPTPLPPPRCRAVYIDYTPRRRPAAWLGAKRTLSPPLLRVQLDSVFHHAARLACPRLALPSPIHVRFRSFMTYAGSTAPDARRVAPRARQVQLPQGTRSRGAIMDDDALLGCQFPPVHSTVRLLSGSIGCVFRRAARLSVCVCARARSPYDAAALSTTCKIDLVGLRCSTTCYNLEACVVLNGLRPTRRPQWHNGSLTALGGMCLAMWRSKHPTHYVMTMTIRPELTVTPYRATSRHRSASVSAASVGRGRG